MFSTLDPNYPSKKAIWAIAVLCLSYLIFQLIYIPYPTLSLDEFWFAHHIYEYTHKLPYRDFLPYKTVLGYYLFSIPLFFWHTLLEPLYYIKDEIALINTLFLAGISYWLMRFFNPTLVLCSVLLILASHLFLIYSVDLRVDMLTAWLALVSVLLLLSNRFALAGVVLALTFMVSQKALWFFIASNFALGCYWLVISRQWQVVRQAILFNVAMIITIGVYIAFWSMHSSLNTVLHSVFYEGYTQSKITWYSSIYYYCWTVILRNGPLLVFLFPLTWISLWVHTQQNDDYPRRFFIITYATLIMFFIVSYQQAFPYGMVLAIPAYFLVYPDFFSWIKQIFQHPLSVKPFNQRLLFWFISLYTIATISLLIFMRLPMAYYLIILIPILLGFLLITPTVATRLLEPLKIAFFIIIFSTGILYPMIRFSIVAYLLNGHYQKSMMITADALLKEGGGFFAGTPLIYNQDQAIPGLRNLIGPAIEYLSNPSEKLLPIMISSLYLEPRTADEVIYDLKITPVKFYVNNYRIVILPASIQTFLKTEFTHYWGSIYIYAPKVESQSQFVFIKFSGFYKVIAKSDSNIYLDNKKIEMNDKIYLTQGMHASKATRMYRLKYIPQNKIILDKRYKNDAWFSMNKPILT